MRRLRFLFYVLLCCGLAIGVGLVACGEDDTLCETFCKYRADCLSDDSGSDMPVGVPYYMTPPPNLERCMFECKHQRTTIRWDCVFGCGPGLSCWDFDRCRYSCEHGYE